MRISLLNNHVGYRTDIFVIFEKQNVLPICVRYIDIDMTPSRHFEILIYQFHSRINYASISNSINLPFQKKGHLKKNRMYKIICNITFRNFTNYQYATVETKEIP